MSIVAVVAAVVATVLYIEIAVGTGYYMYLITKGEGEAGEDGEQKQIKRYSILAGVFFPITLAILIAGRAAERRK